jgi:hypothetical protein
MNVFILCTGRSGSSSLIAACSHITNYSCGHESRAGLLGEARLAYPEGHIEADNRLSWMLGPLEDRYGNSAFYVHLTRDREATISSFNRRWSERTSIVRAYSEGVLKTPIETLSKADQLSICADYYDTVNSNIRHFMDNKSNVLSIRLAHLEEDFKNFWDSIGAEGNLDMALQELSTHHNPSANRFWLTFGYNIKLFLLRMKIAVLGR